VNFGVLKSEVLARGFNFQDAARVGRWVNQAHAELCDQEDWPFLQAAETGVPPLAISDLGVVLGVSCGTIQLAPADQIQLEDDYSDLTVQGAPTFYFPTTTGIGTYPLTTDEIRVRYSRVPDDMTDDSDEPLPPARFHELIVLGALRRAALEESDGPDYQTFDAEWQRGVQTMRERVLLWHRDGNQSMLMTADHGDS